MTAKEFLTQGYRISDRIKSLTRQLNTLRNSTPTPNYNNVGGHNSEIVSSTETKGLKALELEKKLSDEIARLEAVQLAIYNAIEGLDNINEKLVLRYKYIESLSSWEVIAYKMGYCDKQAKRIHGKALEHIQFEGKK